MLFERRLKDGLEDGTISLAFRRWRRRQVVPGRRYRTGRRLVAVEAVDVVTLDEVSGVDLEAAGYSTIDELTRDLRGDDSLPLFRIQLSLVDEPDPRAVLAASADLTQTDIDEIDRRLDRLDRANSIGPWTRSTLATIEANPAVRAADLAVTFGQEKLPFKRNVRKLKELGLTISLEVGYRLSPRGAAYVSTVSRPESPARHQREG